MPGRIVGRTVDLERQARLHADAAGARAAHPPRQGDVQHLHEPGPAGHRGDDLHVADGPAGPRARRSGLARAHARARRGADARQGRARAFDGPFFHEAVLLLDRPVAPVLKALAARGILGGLDLERALSRAGPRAARLRHRDQDRRRHRALRERARRGAASRARRLRNDMPCEHMPEKVIFEYSQSGPRRHGPVAAGSAASADATFPQNLRRKQPPLLPEVSELEAVRHFTRLSQLNFSIDTHFYPLGSCTMKYNPKACNQYAMLPEFLGAPSARAGVARPGLPRLHVRAAGDAEGSDRHAGRRRSTRWPARTASSPAWR